MSNSVEAGKVVLTGAGGGIGLGLAQEFARRGFNVVALLHVQGRTRKMADRRRRRTAHGRFHRINDEPGDRVKSAQGSDISAPADHQSWRRGACIVHPPQPRIASIKHAIRLTAGCSNNHLTESEKRSPAKGTSFLDSKSDYRRTAE